MSMVIWGTVAAGLALIGRLDRAILPGAKGKAAVLAAGAAGSVLLEQILDQGETPAKLALSLVMGCLLLASVTDAAICQVYNFTWWLSGAAAAVLMAVNFQGIRAVGELLLFCGLQFLLFDKMYGRADCYAFCVCAAAEAGLGFGMAGFFFHMSAAFLLLAFVQAVKKNIGGGWRLKKPVPFLPYITAAFYMMLLFVKICREMVVPLS